MEMKTSEPENFKIAEMNSKEALAIVTKIQEVELSPSFEEVPDERFEARPRTNSSIIKPFVPGGEDNRCLPATPGASGSRCAFEHNNPSKIGLLDMDVSELTMVKHKSCAIPSRQTDMEEEKGQDTVRLPVLLFTSPKAGLMKNKDIETLPASTVTKTLHGVEATNSTREKTEKIRKSLQFLEIKEKLEQ